MQGIFSSSRRNDIDARTRMVQLEEGLRSRRTEIESSDTQRNQQIAEIDRRLAGNRDDSVGLELRKQRGDLLRARNRVVATRLLEEVRRRGPGDNSQAHELLIRKLTLESQRGF